MDWAFQAQPFVRNYEEEAEELLFISWIEDFM